MRVGGPNIRPPQWIEPPPRLHAGELDRPRAVVDQAFEVDRAEIRTAPPRRLGPILRVIVHQLGLERAVRRIVRAVASALLTVLLGPLRLFMLLFELFRELFAREPEVRTQVQSPGAGRGSHGPAVRVDGPNGFLFKPRSDSDGKAVVLLPEKLTGKIDQVVLKGPDGQVIEKGRFSGIANGDRAHFRFSRPGGAYPPGTTVEVRLDDGSTRQWTLTNPAVRHD